MRHCYEFGNWPTWCGTHWRTDLAAAEQRAKDAVLKLYDEVRTLSNPDDRKALLDHAQDSESVTRIAAMLSLARSEPGIPVRPDDLDRDIWLFNCLNGTLDLRSGELRPHRREDLITRIAPVAYDPTAECSKWNTFLKRIMDGNDDLVAFLRRAVGYSLTGSTSERCIFILYGGGKNGKTVFIEAVRMLFGEWYAARTPTQTLMAKRGDAIPNDVARLKGARFVSACETGEGKVLDEAAVKDMTGGDRIAARFMRAEWFEFTPHFKIFLSTNHKPRIIGRDDAIWDRIRLVPFEVRISDNERRPMDELLAEFRAELPGILAWAVKGCMEWQRERIGDAGRGRFKRRPTTSRKWIRWATLSRNGASVCPKRGHEQQLLSGLSRVGAGHGRARPVAEDVLVAHGRTRRAARLWETAHDERSDVDGHWVEGRRRRACRGSDRGHDGTMTGYDGTR